MVVQHNLTAMNSNRMLNITVKSQAKSTEKLSSGYRINRAADDAAGLSISEKMRKQIRGLTQASANAQDGISMVQTADGALEEVHAMLQRANELAVKAANGTLSDDDRNYIKNEIDQLNTEIDRVRTTSKFNETYLFPEKEDGSAGLEKNGTTYMLDSGKVFSVNLTGGEDYNVTTVNGEAVVTRPDGTVDETTILAERVANEFVPNAIKQIFEAFPHLDSGTELGIDLIVEHIDGPGKKLAFATGTISFTVDLDDFDNDDALGTGNNASMLESTIAHELMHTVMFKELGTRMGGATATDFPDWFIEGSAQQAGGVFGANWNSEFKGIADPVNNKSAVETQIKAMATITDARDYDKTPSAEKYGTGGMATAYLGYLINKEASGSAAVTDANIAKGLDRLFEHLKNNPSETFSDAIKYLTGASITSSSDFYSLINTPDSDYIDFVAGLTAAAGADGLGSMIAGGLNVGGTDILGDDADQQKIKVKGVYALDTGVPTAKAALNLHVGADATSNNQIRVLLFDIGSKALGTASMDFTSQDGARKAIDKASIAIQRVSAIRSYYGAIQNRLDHTINNLDNVVENTTAAESAIRDTDMATEMVRYSNNNILAQAGQAMLAQSNQSNQGVLSLLQ